MTPPNSLEEAMSLQSMQQRLDVAATANNSELFSREWILRTIMRLNDEEIGEIKDLLKENRLVMLSGAGGSGKTRLAIQVAEGLQEGYPDGMWLVELANIREPSLVLPTIANVLNIAEKTNVSLTDVLKRELSRKHLLLLIDNFEHLLDSASLISELLATAPRLSILGTSRERLHINGEQEYPVSPLNRFQNLFSDLVPI